jgi:putative transposase
MTSFLASVKVSITRKAEWFRKTSQKPAATWEQFYDVQPSGIVHFRFWQRGGGYDRNLWSKDEIVEKLEYVHNNPVRRGLCKTPADWYWSSAAHYAGLGESPVPIESPMF